MLGILPPIVPTFCYIIEQINYHILGASESGSMIKGFIVFVV
jgi:hypothetical protein